MGHVILPNILVNNWGHVPLFFFIGPCRGGGDWQHEGYRLLDEEMAGEEFCAVIPMRYPSNHPLRTIALPGIDNAFPHQTAWERHYIDKALMPRKSIPGCVIAYLPVESVSDPHPGPEPYGMDTRGELGEIRGRMMHNHFLRFSVGAEEEFPGLRTIRRNSDMAFGFEFPFYPSLRSTIRRAITVARGR